MGPSVSSVASDGQRPPVRRVTDGRSDEPGKMAGWVAPPSKGIHAKPVDFEYVKI